MKTVLIIGAGIGGLTTALALAQRGFAVEVLEQAPAIKEVGAGLQLSPNAMAVYSALGIADQIEALSCEPRAGILRNGKKGTPLMKTEMGEVYHRRYSHKYLHIHRADLIETLLLNTKKHNINIHLGMNIKESDIEQDPIRVQIGHTALQGNYLIAADGIRSQFRNPICGESRPEFTGQIAWRGIIPTQSVPKNLIPFAANNWLGHGQHFVSYYVKGGTMINFVAVKEQAQWTEERWDMPANKSELAAAFSGWDSRISQLIEACDESFLWGLFDHAPLPHWTKGRMALLGDAAHPMLPFMAQGAAMAIEDAWVLAACLAKYENDPHLALERYETARKPRTTFMQSISRQNAALYHMRPGLGRMIRDLKFQAATLFSPALLARLDKIYGVDVTQDYPA